MDCHPKDTTNSLLFSNSILYPSEPRPPNSKPKKLWSFLNFFSCCTNSSSFEREHPNTEKRKNVNASTLTIVAASHYHTSAATSFIDLRSANTTPSTHENSAKRLTRKYLDSYPFNELFLLGTGVNKILAKINNVILK